MFTRQYHDATKMLLGNLLWFYEDCIKICFLRLLPTFDLNKLLGFDSGFTGIVLEVYDDLSRIFQRFDWDVSMSCDFGNSTALLRRPGIRRVGQRVAPAVQPRDGAGDAVWGEAACSREFLNFLDFIGSSISLVFNCFHYFLFVRASGIPANS